MENKTRFELAERAHTRMDGMNWTEQEQDFIFGDWSNIDEHYAWLLSATRAEISNWLNLEDYQKGLRWTHTLTTR